MSRKPQSNSFGTRRYGAKLGLVGLLALTSCGYTETGEPRYCEANPQVCAFVAFVIVGGILHAHAGGDSDGGGATIPIGVGGGSGTTGGTSGTGGGGGATGTPGGGFGFGFDPNRPPGGAVGGRVGNASDPSLKQDVQYLRTLENGLRLYAFRYIGQEEGFVGVMADEILADPRYAHAVVQGPGGVLLVDYEQLPVRLVNYPAMQRASEAVLRSLGG